MESIKRKLFWLFFLFFFFSLFTLKAQEIKKTDEIPAGSYQVVLRIKGLQDENIIAKVKSTFDQYKGKIFNYAFDKNSNLVTVIISEKLQKVDLLQVLEMEGIHAGFLNENKQYVTLDNNDDDNLSAPIIISK